MVICWGFVVVCAHLWSLHASVIRHLQYGIVNWAKAYWLSVDQIITWKIFFLKNHKQNVVEKLASLFSKSMTISISLDQQSEMLCLFLIYVQSWGLPKCIKTEVLTMLLLPYKDFVWFLKKFFLTFYCKVLLIHMSWVYIQTKDKFNGAIFAGLIYRGLQSVKPRILFKKEWQNKIFKKVTSFEICFQIQSKI